MIDHLSSSGASLWTQCPRQWHAKYVDRIVDPPTVATEVGTIVHSVLERIFTEPPAKRDENTAKRFARQVWDEWETDVGVETVDGDGPTMRRTVWERLGTAHQLDNWAETDVVAVETDLSCDLNGVPFVGYADRLSRAPHGLVVTDYKTGSAPAKQYQTPKLRQIVLYAAATEQVTGERPTEGRLLFLGAKPGIVPVRITDRIVRETIDWFADVWDQILAAYDTGQYPATPSALCGWCPIVHECETGLAAVKTRHVQGRNIGPAASLI